MPQHPALAAIWLGAAAMAVAAYVLFVRLAEGRWPGELQLPAMAPGLLAGAGYGGLLIGAAMAVIAGLGGYRVSGVRLPPTLAQDLAFWVFVAVGQELAFRGLVFRLVEQRWGGWPAVAVSGALFGAFHLINPHAGLLAAAALAIESVGAYAAVYMLSRSLWAVIGVHLAWNAVEASGLGATDSGEAYPGLLVGGLAGPPWLTGGAFGPEASLVTVAVCAAAGAALLWLAHRRGEFRRPAREGPRANLPGQR